MTNEIFKGNIHYSEETGLITKLSRTLSSSHSSDEQIDLNENLVVPSLVDIHAHLRDFNENHKETFESAAKAAAAGGYTHVFDMPNKNPPIDSSDKIKLFKEKAHKIPEIEILPYLLLCEKTVRSLDYNYPFMKGYLGYTTGENLTPESVLVEYLKKGQGFLSIHCEDNKRIEKNLELFKDKLRDHCEIRDEVAEIKCIKKLKALMNRISSNVELHVAHLTLRDSINLLEPTEITFEVTPHHLCLSKKDYEKLGVWGKMNPPLRPMHHQEMLFRSFLEGKIDIIATDHAPHTREEKMERQLNGVPGFETALAVTLNVCQPLNEFKLKLIINAFAINPRKIMGITSGGIIAPGEVADLSVIDLNLVKTIKGDDLQTKCKWSPWEGQTIQGWPVMTIHQGTIMYDDLKG